MQTNPEIQPKEMNEKAGGFFNWVERAGNKVPHPVYLFIWFFVIAMISSTVLSLMNVQAINPATNKTVAVVNMLTGTTLGNFFVNMVKEFVNFAPVGMVLVVTIGLGVANGSGLLSTSLKLASVSKSKVVTTLIVFLIGINGNIAGDAAFVIYPPLVAILFKGTGRNPLAGLFTGFASVACGFGANLLVGSADASLAGMTQAAARIVDPTYVASPAMGYYFLLFSTFFLAPIGTWVTLHFVEPKLNRLGVGVCENDVTNKIGDINLTIQERKGLKLAGLAFLIYIAVIVLMTLPGFPFAAPKDGTIITGPLMKSIPPLIMFMFFIPGYVYGKVVGTIKDFTDSIKMMSNELKTLAGFLVICFVASQFIAVFRDSNIAFIIAIRGGNFLKSTGIQGPFLMGVFVLLVGFINLFMGSANAKWALLSTVFVPMLMIAGVDPSATQAAYRIGDSITNNITPTLPYLAIVLSYAQEYDPRAKTGTVIAYMLPYSIAFTIAWIILLLIWLFLGFPMGPGYFGFLN